jgi:hypothetical protein
MSDHPAPEVADGEMTAEDVLYVIEDDPPAVRPRWYCHEYPPGFDDVDEAVAWALSRARTVIVRTLAPDFYWAGAPPRDRGDGDVETRPWPPSASERAKIDAAYAEAVRGAAADDQARIEYEQARDTWLAEHASQHAGTEPTHACLIDVPGGGSIAFEEWESGAVCGARATNGGPIAFGAAANVVASTSGLSDSDPWVAAVVAALDHERTWRSLGRRSILDVRVGAGEMFHVAAADNRDSILVHGLDWRRMSGHGIAGSQGPELDAIFLCESVDETDFFLGMARSPSDVWGVRVDDLVIENGPDGWWIVTQPVPPDRLNLVRSDVAPRRWDAGL